MATGFRRLLTDGRQMSRRSFFAMSGWLAFVGASAIALFQSVRYMQPNALYEDPAAFKADPPGSYAVGSTTVLTDKRVVINRDPDGFYAISLICTHLGCTPRYFPDVTSDLIAQGTGGLRANQQNKELPGFKCPCHGSRYYRDAVNFYGPAPRPMDRVHLEVARDGKLFIDRSIIVDRSFRLKA
jgi:cytochrome b6-f complex iron-sulfur subunit